MCNDYANKIGAAEIGGAFSHLRIPLTFPDGVPNIEPRDDIRITDRAAVVRAGAGPDAAAELIQMRWSWPAPNGEPVYNFRSEGRRFGANRCLIPADGFYEFTAAEPGAKRKTKWLFTPAPGPAGAALVPEEAGTPWFCIAGLWQPSPHGDAFTMLTAPPGEDVAPYHNRGIVVLPAARWGEWLAGGDAAGLLGPLPAGSLIASRAPA